MSAGKSQLSFAPLRMTSGHNEKPEELDHKTKLLYQMRSIRYIKNEGENPVFILLIVFLPYACDLCG